jgi:hypothetical protein
MYVAIVRMDTPGVDHDTAVEVSLGSTATFTGLKDRGLLKKYYLSNEAGGSGGVYLWESKEAAEAWYTPEWADRLENTYGARPTVTYFDSFVQVDNVSGQVVVDGKPAQV